MVGTFIPQAMLFERLQNCLLQELSPLSGSGQAAVLMALSDASEPELLLIRRGLQLPTHPGEIALRESWEEVALPTSRFRHCGSLAPRTSLNGLAVTAVVGVVPRDLPLVADAREVDELIWAPLHFFADAANLRADRVMRNGGYGVAARYQYLHYTIWGLTAGFIVELVNRLYGVNLDVAALAQYLLEKTTSPTFSAAVVSDDRNVGEGCKKE